MKKKIILLSLLIALMMFVLSACSDGHTHTYSDDWSSSSDGHWKDSTCEHEGKSEMSVHSFDDGAISTDKTVIFYTCSVCGYIDQKEHTHSFTDWQTTEAASIFEKGEQTRSCTHVLCGETECRDVPKIEVSSILINTYPEKLVYIENESFKPNGLKVSAIDAEGNHTDITDLVEFDKTTLTGSDTQVISSMTTGHPMEAT